MKLDARQAAGFLRSPGAVRAVLLHGDDEGLIRERAEHLTRAIAGSLGDPFRVVELERADWPRIPEEMASLCLMGGRRAIRVRDVGDAVTDAVRSALKGPGDAMLVLEASGLGRGRLRTLIESAPDAAAIGCYPEEGRALTDTIRAMLAEHGATADADAIAWLAQTIGGDRSLMRGEVEKLALLVGAGGRIDLDAAREAAGDSSGSSADAGLLAATAGDAAAADAAIDVAIAEGLAGVGLLRMALMHLQRLHQARLRMAQGVTAAEAIKALRPPIFFKSIPGMTASLARWSEPALLRMIEEAVKAEAAAKQTGSRPELLARRFVASLARVRS